MLLVEGLMQALLGAPGTPPAFLGDAQLYPKITESASAAGDGGFDLFFGDCTTNTNVHCPVSSSASGQPGVQWIG
ncbi:hypothetical protein GCM10007933_04000 [Zoogloea oryzae]|uniref:Uncharacterized protein n=1 Tax=Zoogloea oryzae TaxID=310767 RepID=A0ABQ6F5Z3_9RHOO|nr:hypothetical protein GCM10007933_04000 [Zoogloea oryzae]